MYRRRTPFADGPGADVMVLIPVSFMTVWPTTAPARLCAARGAEIPGSLARSAAGSSARMSMHPRRSQHAN
jgi:hypothetical protein